MGYHIGSFEVLKSLQMYDSSNQRSRRFPSVFGIGQKYTQHAVQGRFSRIVLLMAWKGLAGKFTVGILSSCFIDFLVFIFHFQGSRLAGYEPIGATMTKR